jgi:hypothetical protein
LHGNIVHLEIKYFWQHSDFWFSRCTCGFRESDI